MYPEPLQVGGVIEANTAVVLVGNGGSETINYLQFVHDSLPAINARGISLPPGGIVGVRVPVGTIGLSLSNYTMSRQPGGYLPNGLAYGYVPVRTPAIDINSRGFYYVATVFPGQERKFEITPTPSSLVKFRKERREIADLIPVNFNWPN